jgi:uncharacterized integral membrane protein
MQMRTVLLMLMLALVALFALLNWGTITTPTALNLLVARIDAPLGIFMLGLLGVITVIYMLLLARAETVALLETRKLARELEKARKLADDNEESRFQGLRVWLEAELAEVHRRLDAITPQRPASEPPAAVQEPFRRPLPPAGV